MEVLMDELRERVKARLCTEIAQAHPDSPLLAPGVFDEVETILRRAAETRRVLLLPELLPGAEEITLETSLRFRSHRRLTGRSIVWIKRRMLLPLLRWLYEFSRDNFVRQERVNALLMASLETLVIEVVRLRQEVTQLRGDPSSRWSGDPS